LSFLPPVFSFAISAVPSSHLSQIKCWFSVRLPPPNPLPTSFCPIYCIVQNGFLLQETSSRKSQSASPLLPPRKMFSAIHNNSSTPPRISTLANFTSLFNRRCLVNSLRNSGKSFYSLTSLGCSVAN